MPITVLTNAFLIDCTGKEPVAHSIHDRSPRKDRPFVKINCTAIPLPCASFTPNRIERNA